MLKPSLAGAAFLALTACAPTAKDVEELRALSEITCAQRPENCAYENSPVKVADRPVTLPRRPYRFFPLAEPLRFTDARTRTWSAPSGTLTDGASIPEIFVAIVGQPTAPEYVNAAALHDAYCGIGNEGGANYHNGRWEDVHRMFYDALVASGTPDQRAKIMFAAVWLGGPRWNIHYTLDQVPDVPKQRAMRAAKRYVEERDPSLAQLEARLRRLERQLIRQHPGLFPFMNPDDVEREADHGTSEEPGQEGPGVESGGGSFGQEGGGDGNDGVEGYL